MRFYYPELRGLKPKVVKRVASEAYLGSKLGLRRAAPDAEDEGGAEDEEVGGECSDSCLQAWFKLIRTSPIICT